MLGLIGSGNMARALARGWGDPVLATDAGSGRARALVDELGGEAIDDPADLARRADAVLLCHKPAQLEAIATRIAESAAGKPVISVLGGVTLERLRTAYPGSATTRAMPNTPAEVRQGVICLAEESDDLETARELFARVGRVHVLPERLMEAATATMGVSPAYVALLLEAHIDAAVKHGLPSRTATDLAVESFAGASALLRARHGDTLAVRREVASPGGSTARGLAALEAAGARHALLAAMEAVLNP